MEYIPPPEFSDENGVKVHCCKCAATCRLCWFDDKTWQRLIPVAQCGGGHLCVGCAEQSLGRPLTLNDLAVEKFLMTQRNEVNGPIIHCVVDIVIGAAQQAGVQLPFHWCSMWKEYTEIGAKLASQTPNAQQVVPELINQALRHFPDFSNPYSAQPRP